MFNNSLLEHLKSILIEGYNNVVFIVHINRKRSLKLLDIRLMD